MTPREKAEQLFLKHYDFAEGYTDHGKIDSAIELSLITSDECINASQWKAHAPNVPDWETTEYWQQVQVELNARSFLNAEDLLDLPAFEGTIDRLNDL